MHHTPGPWTQLDQEHAISIVSGGIVIADVFKPDDNCVSPIMSETLDNARLIAAAPELLRELKSAIFYIETYGGDVTTSFSAGGNLDAVKAIIAKAEGKE